MTRETSEKVRHLLALAMSSYVRSHFRVVFKMLEFKDFRMLVFVVKKPEIRRNFAVELQRLTARVAVSQSGRPRLSKACAYAAA